MTTFAQLSRGIVQPMQPLYNTGIEVSTNNNLIFTKYDQKGLKAVEKVAIKYLSAKSPDNKILQQHLDGEQPIHTNYGPTDSPRLEGPRYHYSSLTTLFNRIFYKLHSFFKFTTNSHFVTFAYQHEGLDENGKLKNTKVIELALDDKNYEEFQKHFSK